MKRQDQECRGIDEEWPTVGWETLAKANPTYIVLADLQRRKFPADAVDVKMDFLKNDPVASQMDAVKEGRILILVHMQWMQRSGRFQP